MYVCAFACSRSCAYAYVQLLVCAFVFATHHKLFIFPCDEDQTCALNKTILTAATARSLKVRLIVIHSSLYNPLAPISHSLPTHTISTCSFFSPFSTIRLCLHPPFDPRSKPYSSFEPMLYLTLNQPMFQPLFYGPHSHAL